MFNIDCLQISNYVRERLISILGITLGFPYYSFLLNYDSPQIGKVVYNYFYLSKLCYVSPGIERVKLSQLKDEAEVDNSNLKNEV